jgi:hypothetical protein
LTDDDIQDAYTEIEAVFPGVSQLWAALGTTIQAQKVNLCYNYLVAWYLCDMYPMKVRGVDADGGRPLSSKTIGGTTVNFAQLNSQSAMQALTSNTFGIKAKQMIETSPEAMGYYG